VLEEVGCCMWSIDISTSRNLVAPKVSGHCEWMDTIYKKFIEYLCHIMCHVSNPP
jgi:hypothetical protein